jgi:precorrin-3B C17-methyltransferase
VTGRLAVVGLGPGGEAGRTTEAVARLAAATDLVGYHPYLEQVGPMREGQCRYPFDNREEVDRAAFALELAAAGRDVVIVSSGDPGIFAMATAVIEQLHRDGDRWAGVEVSIIPGVTAASAAAARIGAPLGHDLCLISLSDVLKPWDVIERRVAAAAAADFVIAFYNPISRHRPWQLGRAMSLVGGFRSPDTPVVVARRVGRIEESVRVTTVAGFDPEAADMGTVIIVGSSTTVAFTDGAGRQWVYTPRSYAPRSSGIQ